MNRLETDNAAYLFIADLISKFSLEVYSDPVDAAYKALGIR